MQSSKNTQNILKGIGYLIHVFVCLFVCLFSTSTGAISNIDSYIFSKDEQKKGFAIVLQSNERQLSRNQRSKQRQHNSMYK